MATTCPLQVSVCLGNTICQLDWLNDTLESECVCPSPFVTPACVSPDNGGGSSAFPAWLAASPLHIVGFVAGVVFAVSIPIVVLVVQRRRERAELLERRESKGHAGQ